MSEKFPRRERDRWSAEAFRVMALTSYVMAAYGMCHDGETPAEFGTLLVLGGVALPFLVLADWIARGAPQVGDDV